MTIPQPVLKALDWKEGDAVKVGISNNSMIVEKEND
jgi:antitoxin component of MazEF toxin-antitoxin module